MDFTGLGYGVSRLLVYTTHEGILRVLILRKTLNPDRIIGVLF
jgi:hypothetical protein